MRRILLLMLLLGVFVFCGSMSDTPVPAHQDTPSTPVEKLSRLTWRELTAMHEKVNKLPPGLLEATCDYESRPTDLNPVREVARSPKGALGVCQVLPVTAAWLAGYPLPVRSDFQSVRDYQDAVGTYRRVVEAMGKALRVNEVNTMYAGQYMRVCYNRWKRIDYAVYCYNNGHNDNRPRAIPYTKIVMVIYAQTVLDRQGDNMKQMRLSENKLRAALLSLPVSEETKEMFAGLRLKNRGKQRHWTKILWRAQRRVLVIMHAQNLRAKRMALRARGDA